MGRYTFAYDLLERYVETIWILLLVFISVVVYMGPKGPVRTISLLLCIPMAILAALGSCAVATGFNEYPDQVESVVQSGDVTFKQVANYDLTYEEICRQRITLKIERPIFNGLLKETVILISVSPALAANTELGFEGKQICFSSPALLGRKAIVRYFNTDWDQALKKYEFIDLTTAERVTSDK